MEINTLEIGSMDVNPVKEFMFTQMVQDSKENSNPILDMAKEDVYIQPGMFTQETGEKTSVVAMVSTNFQTVKSMMGSGEMMKWQETVI